MARSEHPTWKLNWRTEGKNWGNFISANGLNTGRFLDPPEFVVFHDKGNEENLFDRVDYQLTNIGLHSLELWLQPELVSDAEQSRCRKRDTLEWTLWN